VVEAGLPGGPATLTLEDLYPALRQRLVSMGLPPPNQRGVEGANLPVFSRNLARRLGGAAAPATSAPARSSATAGVNGVGTAPAARTAAPGSASPGSAASPTSPAGPLRIPGAGTPMLTAGPPIPAMLTAAPGSPGNGHPNGNGNGSTNGNGNGGPKAGSPPVSGTDPAPVVGSGLGPRPIAGPEPPSRPTTGSTPAVDIPPPPPASEAKPLPGSEPGTSDPSPGAPEAEVATAVRRWRRRRMWLPALALAAALLVPALYVIRPSGKGGAGGGGRDGGVEVDLREAGNRTISLGKGVRPIALLQDDQTLWVQAGAAGTSAELTKVDLDTGEVVDRVPFPDSDSLGTIAVGAGSLWVTTSSVESMGGAVVRIDPDSGDVIATVPLPVWPGRTVFTAGSLWVATVQQPMAEELGATPRPMSSAANGLSRIDPETNEVAASIQLEATPMDVRADDDLVLVATQARGEATVVAIDPWTDREVARVDVPARAEAPSEPESGGPWMLFAADPYAVRVDIESEEIAAVTGPRDGVDMIVPNDEQMWELRSDVLTILDDHGDEVVTVTIDGTVLAAATAGRGAAWIAYRPSDSDEVLVTRVPAAELVHLSGSD
jgi:hypothetical protein